MASPPKTIADPAKIDLYAARQTIRAGKATDAWLASWMPGTYASPERFRGALFAESGARREAPLASRPGAACELYRDFVAAHLGKRRVALVEPRGDGWERTSFDALHVRVTALASAWAEAGVEAGQCVAIVLAPGLDLWVSLLAAFHSGAVAAIVSPLGPAFVRSRLALLAPDRVATSERHLLAIGPIASPVLPIAAPSRASPGVAPRTYEHDAPAMRLASPFAHTLTDAVSEISAGVLLEGAVRDATLVYCLDPGEVLAAPGFDPLQFQPSFLLSALVAGAAWAELPDEPSLDAPSALERAGVSVLGVRSALRDRLLARGGDDLKPPLRAWFRSLTETQDVTRWDDFGALIARRRLPGFGIVAHPAAGGCQLASGSVPAAPTLRVWPAAGVPWLLTEIAGGAVPAFNDTGICSIVRDEEPVLAPPNVVIGRYGECWVYSGVVPLGPEAQAYPFAEVEAVAARHPDVRYAAAFVVGGRHLNEAHSVLLAFVDATPSPDGTLDPSVSVAELRSLVVAEVGERYAPERIEVFPLRPRIVDGAVDRVWCRAQYLSGNLYEKARSAPFLILSRLGYMFGPPRGGA